MRLMCEQPGIMADKELSLKPQREYMWMFSNKVTNTVYTQSYHTLLAQGVSSKHQTSILMVWHTVVYQMWWGMSINILLWVN